MNHGGIDLDVQMRALTEPKISINQFFIIAGFLMGLISLFTLWISIDFNDAVLGISGWYLTTSDHVSGFGLDEMQRYIPVAVFLMSLIGTFLVAIKVALPDKMTRLEILIPVLGLIMLIMTIIFGVWDTKYVGEAFDNAGIGIWISILGSVLILLFGTIEMISSVMKKNN